MKAIVRNISKEKKISAQLVLQNYMLERFLERVSLSAYRDHFIIKGGFLIASMVGLDSRATMDTERFVRGDLSRSSQGSGLGLEIAKNLTLLQGGTFDIMLDGDLFKVVLKFLPADGSDGQEEAA